MLLAADAGAWKFKKVGRGGGCRGGGQVGEGGVALARRVRMRIGREMVVHNGGSEV